MNGGGESNVKFSVIKPGSMMVNLNLVISRTQLGFCHTERGNF